MPESAGAMGWKAEEIKVEARREAEGVEVVAEEDDNTEIVLTRVAPAEEHLYQKAPR